MKSFLWIASLATVALSGMPLSAAMNRPACKLHFTLNVISSITVSRATGSGRMTCANSSLQNSFSRAISVRIEDLPLGRGQFVVNVESSLIGVADPGEISGIYLVEESSSQSLEFYSQDNGLSFEAHFVNRPDLLNLFNGTYWIVD